MTKIDKKVEIQQFTYADLSEEFWESIAMRKEEYSKGVRFIVCYNSGVARCNKLTRERNIGRFDELVNDTRREGKLGTMQESHYRLRSYLSKYHMSKFYELKIKKDEEKSREAKAPLVPSGKEDIYKLHIERQDAAIAEEAGLDGRYFIQTEMEELDTIRLVPLYIPTRRDENPLYISTQIGNNVKKLFSSLAIRKAINPEKLRIAGEEQYTAQNQLELNFGA